jgi:hypothetical protein
MDNTDVAASGAWTWQDHSRFVQVAPVQHGWLVLWGRFLDRHGARALAGDRIYVDLDGARRRVADAVFELTRNPALVAEAMVQFDRAVLPRHRGLVPVDPL